MRVPNYIRFDRTRIAHIPVSEIAEPIRVQVAPARKIHPEIPHTGLEITVAIQCGSATVIRKATYASELFEFIRERLAVQFAGPRVITATPPHFSLFFLKAVH